MGCRTLGCGLTPELGKASLSQSAPTPSPGGANAQRWSPPPRGVGDPPLPRPPGLGAFGAAVRVSEATPGGHLSEDSRRPSSHPRSGGADSGLRCGVDKHPQEGSG